MSEETGNEQAVTEGADTAVDTAPQGDVETPPADAATDPYEPRYKELQGKFTTTTQELKAANDRLAERDALLARLTQPAAPEAAAPAGPAFADDEYVDGKTLKQVMADAKAGLTAQVRQLQVEQLTTLFQQTYPDLNTPELSAQVGAILHNDTDSRKPLVERMHEAAKKTRAVLAKYRDEGAKEERGRAQAAAKAGGLSAGQATGAPTAEPEETLSDYVKSRAETTAQRRTL